MADDKTPRPHEDEPKKKDHDLGYAQGAGHPGGEQDLDKKTETEAEHDSFEHHE
jgi:hypothetical protein